MRQSGGVLGEAGLWFQSKKLQLHEDKTKRTLHFLCDAEKPEKGDVKLLGFVLDSELTLESPVAEVCRRLARVLTCWC